MNRPYALTAEELINWKEHFECRDLKFPTDRKWNKRRHHEYKKIVRMCRRKELYWLLDFRRQPDPFRRAGRFFAEGFLGIEIPPVVTTHEDLYEST